NLPKSLVILAQLSAKKWLTAKHENFLTFQHQLGIYFPNGNQADPKPAVNYVDMYRISGHFL
ncbi:MAG TPA: hypothetical protein DCE52_00140, partial [Rhodobacteraceae bacterium]|nr:hypothetical protein [Paracoccaceae bacterium]